MSDEKVPHPPKTPGYASIVVFVAIIAGVYAMIEPMSQRITTLEQTLQNQEVECSKKIEDIRTQMIADDVREREDRGEFATMSAQFQEVEAHFFSTNSRVNNLEEWSLYWQRTSPYINATQDERLRALERKIYKSDPGPKIPLIREHIPNVPDQHIGSTRTRELQP